MSSTRNDLLALKAKIKNFIEDGERDSDEIPGAVETAIQESPVAELAAWFGAAFLKVCLDTAVSKQIQAFESVFKAIDLSDPDKDAARYICAAQACIVLDDHCIEEEILKILGLEDEGWPSVPLQVVS
jgi:hypothetical protein